MYRRNVNAHLFATLSTTAKDINKITRVTVFNILRNLLFIEKKENSHYDCTTIVKRSAK